MENRRTINSIRNFSFVIVEQIIHNVIAFICRTIFVITLGKTYLGFNGLFSDVLNLLSLAELGVGTAITFFMYKPTADKNYIKVTAYLNYYRMIYRYIGIIIFLVGLMIAPFIHLLVSDIDGISNLYIIYILFLSNSTISYFFSYNKSILITQQKNYIISIVYMITIFLQNVFQIVFLLLFENYILYLIIQILFTFINNLIIHIYVNRKYSFLKKYKNSKLTVEETSLLKSNIKALFLSKISSVVVTSTDNILISKFVSTVLLGVYSNYTLFINMIKTIITKLFDSIIGSVGNLVSSESNDKSLKIFNNLLFGNFWIVSYSSIMLFIFINPFIKLWIGEDYLLDIYTVLLITINLYMRLMRNTLLSFIDTNGLFNEMKIKNICEAIINLIVSLILVHYFKLGIFGVLLGTFISNLVTNFWYEPFILFRKCFLSKATFYFVDIIKYLCISTLMSLVLYFLNERIGYCDNFVNLGARILLFSIIINLCYFIIFIKSEKLKYFINSFRNILKRADSKLISNKF